MPAMFTRQVRHKRQESVIYLHVDRNDLLYTARQRRKHFFQIVLFFLGTVSGPILFRSLSRQPFSCRPHPLNGEPPQGSPVNDKEVMAERILFVGVLTSRRYLKTRAEAVYRTWGSLLNGSISFFVGSGESILCDLPVVVLSDVVDDEYPPRRKSFAMLKFLHRRHSEHFRWFLRADDDLFVDVRRLETLLFSLNSSQWGYIGHPGTGRSWEVGSLGLLDESPYCMGGPGIVLSRDVLEALYGILSECERNTVSDHEDSELGRCVYNATRLSCSTSSKVTRLFKQYYGEDTGAWTESVLRAHHHYMTFHPLKDPRHQYLTAALLGAEYARDKLDRIKHLQAVICCADHLLSNRSDSAVRSCNPDSSSSSVGLCEFPFKGGNASHTDFHVDIEWTFISKTTLYSLQSGEPSRPLAGTALVLGLSHVLRHVRREIIAREGHRKMFTSGNYYFRVVPGVEVQYVVFIRVENLGWRRYFLTQKLDEPLSANRE